MYDSLLIFLISTKDKRRHLTALKCLNPKMSHKLPKAGTPIPKAVVKDQFEFGPWTCTSFKSHILKSEGQERDEYEAQLSLPHLPEMVFDKNRLHIEHQNGFGLEFNALDALKLVRDDQADLKVAEADEWLAARVDSDHAKNIFRPYDWTFTTDYKGTPLSRGGIQLGVSDTNERINIEKLKKGGKIQFYAEMVLFEDELHDSGTSMLKVQIRVMPDYFFILQRFFMRVDKVLVRINDTRVYHEAGTDYILREYTSKQNRVEDLKVPPEYITDPNLLSDHMTKTKEKFEKLTFPTTNPTLKPVASNSRISCTPVSAGSAT
ncbi:hypothetical protein LSH36_347g00017 [Paralvinella palmiformis]|uniref:TIP41-like protein n=1 Tax=Paralvinella palmiformis TaxID=53620 RepID=A0AAD9JGA1_9ANNE|nr:hypothetical protein LSH36_347g00017 [Paralvinella palmiformis]